MPWRVQQRIRDAKRYPVGRKWSLPELTGGLGKGDDEPRSVTKPWPNQPRLNKQSSVWGRFGEEKSTRLVQGRQADPLFLKLGGLACPQETHRPPPHSVPREHQLASAFCD